MVPSMALIVKIVPASQEEQESPLLGLFQLWSLLDFSWISCPWSCPTSLLHSLWQDPGLCPLTSLLHSLWQDPGLCPLIALWWSLVFLLWSLVLLWRSLK